MDNSSANSMPGLLTKHAGLQHGIIMVLAQIFTVLYWFSPPWWYAVWVFSFTLLLRHWSHPVVDQQPLCRSREASYDKLGFVLGTDGNLKGTEGSAERNLNTCLVVVTDLIVEPLRKIKHMFSVWGFHLKGNSNILKCMALVKIQES